ncbi:hypothetical protein Nepgr_026319 [Nepenthes gracilis]|uniref:Uncharacterized protein n=1 Tax=Nepenthes gracilis TaxID=150966 RepID=A0AAD3T8D4_NEPGR|nr:hypothetical protein Nepgr_026319 [Nepenthes gracilis]
MTHRTLSLFPPPPISPSPSTVLQVRDITSPAQISHPRLSLCPSLSLSLPLIQICIDGKLVAQLFGTFRPKLVHFFHELCLKKKPQIPRHTGALILSLQGSTKPFLLSVHLSSLYPRDSGPFGALIKFSKNGGPKLLRISVFRLSSNL